MPFMLWLRQVLSIRRGPERLVRIETHGPFHDPPSSSTDDPLDYDSAIHLDAEDLAEAGIAEAYDRVRPEIERLVGHAEPIEEIDDSDAPAYAIRFRGEVFPVYGPELPDSPGTTWLRATIVFFHIVNAQLTSVDVRFFSLHGGNDLHGIFLTPEQARAAQAYHQRPGDRPMLPTFDMLDEQRA